MTGSSLEVGVQETARSGAGREVVVEGNSKNTGLEVDNRLGVGQGGSNMMAAGPQEGKTELGRKRELQKFHSSLQNAHVALPNLN